MVHILLNPELKNFEHYFTSLWDECNCAVVWAFFGIAFFEIVMKTDLFQPCVHIRVLQMCWCIECSTFTALSFRIWSSSIAIPSCPLALFIVMLPKAHLTSHSRISGFRWVITPSWLSGSWSFLYNSSVFSCHLFLISSASLRWSYHFYPLLCPCLHETFPPLVSLIFWKRSLIFLILLSSSISLQWWLRKTFLSLLAIFWKSGFKWVYLFFSPLPFTSLLFSPICKASSDNHFAFCVSFSWGCLDQCLLYNVRNLLP